RDQQPPTKSTSLPVKGYRGNQAKQPDEAERILVKPAKRLEMPRIREIRLNGGRRCHAPEWIDHHHLKQVAPDTDRRRQYRNPNAYAANAVAKRTRAHRPNEMEFSYRCRGCAVSCYQLSSLNSQPYLVQEPVVGWSAWLGRCQQG